MKDPKRKDIARIVNAVQCYSLLSDNKVCHEFRFSIVRIVFSVSDVKSNLLVFVFFFLLVKSCPLITLNKGLKDSKSHGLLLAQGVF